MNTSDNFLQTRQQFIIKISAHTVKGDVQNLNKYFNEALDSGVSINDIKETLVHIHAYAGFPASILALNTFKQVVEDRVKGDKIDFQGRDNSPITSTEGLYERGEKVQILVTGMSAETLKEITSFAPAIDEYLKEHLFGDLFDRDILTFADREIITVTVLAALHHPFVKSHITGALNVGVTIEELNLIFNIIEEEIGSKESNTGRKILEEIVEALK